jgi:hypothetical protein
LGSLLLAYYAEDGRLIYAGRGGRGISDRELARLLKKLKPLVIEDTPLDVLPPDSSRFGQPVNLARVRWVKPELVCEVKFLAWTDDAQIGKSSMSGCERTSRQPKSGDRSRPRRATSIRSAVVRPPQFPRGLRRMACRRPTSCTPCPEPRYRRANGWRNIGRGSTQRHSPIWRAGRSPLSVT